MTDLEPAYQAAADTLRAAQRVVVVTHENPDGDAVGSLIGALRGLRAAGIAATALRLPAALPREYAWLDVDETTTEPPTGGYALLCVDCGSAARVVPAAVLDVASVIVNIDHHHDNTRFGAVNVVDPDAACCAMMLTRLLRLLGVALNQTIGEPLYVGLVTDTGRFQYSNTGPDAFRFAACLVELGVDPQRVFARVFERVAIPKMRLAGRALARLETRLGGKLAVSWLTRDDLEAAGADETQTDGIVDFLRAIDGVAVAALVRASLNGPGWKVSLRAAADEIDVSRIARNAGGGGHTRAAGFTSDQPLDVVVGFIEREVAGA